LYKKHLSKTEEKLQKMKIQEATEKEYLTVEEAATELGIRPSSVRNYLSTGKLKTYKFKTLTLIKRSEIKRWGSARSQ